MRERPIWLISGIALLFVVVMVVLATRGSSQGRDSSQSTFKDASAAGNVVSAPANAIKISIASSSTKQTWIHQAINQFNTNSKSDGGFQINGKPVFVDIIQEKIDGQMKDYRSGTMVADTLQGKIKPTILSPGEESWITRLNKEWKSTNGRNIVTGDIVALAHTPVVIAMWQSRAMALNAWPEISPGTGWRTISNLTTNPNGWGMYGKPQWGRFKLGYGYVGESNSGTLSAAFMCMIGAGKTSALTLEDVNADGG